MSIEDIAYLQKHSIKQNYIILINSKNRDFELYPEPNYYVVNFDVPFKNVIGFDIIDTSIPRTMYSVDKYNNILYYYIHIDDNITFDDFINNININDKYDPTYNGIFKEFIMPFGDYSLATFIEKFNEEFKIALKDSTDNDIILETSGISEPIDLTDTIQFNCNYPFIFNMNDSTIAETLGFNLLTKKENHNKKYSYYDKFANKKATNYIANKKLYISFINNNNPNKNMLNNIIAPGLVRFTGEPYIILRSPEIEEHSFGSLAYTNNNLGIAKFRTNSIGFNDEKLYITKFPIREFHPIGKLSKITLKFETSEGKLYDFKGINHNLTLAICYYEPKFNNNEEFNSILNPNYVNNFNNYKYNNDEQEIINESDDDEDDITEDINENYSRDNINNYRKMEQKYNYD
jgi:hypothetical protein